MVRTIIAAILLLFGFFMFGTAVLGVYRFRYVLSRMHAAALGDTLGILSCLAGLIVLCGFSFHSLKMAVIVCFLWLAGPVSSHLIAKAEVMTHPHIHDECEIVDK